MMKGDAMLEASYRELVFTPSAPFTLGVELELQIIDLSDFDLGACASDLLSHLEKMAVPAVLSPELTESMIEVSVGVFESWKHLRERLRAVRDVLVQGANWFNVGLSGGGAHPFQRWQQRRIFDNYRFRKVSALYGYLAKQFTVFGQHIHIGCENGDHAMRLLHAFNRFVPHFIALSASSPFFQGAVTSFHSSRLNSVAAFPLSGRSPFYRTWKDFESDYFRPMLQTGIVKSMKDLYWDIRPKPEYGTIELRVCDTPLTMDRASLLAGYMQSICRRLIEEDIQIHESEYLVYSFNRFQACRFGLDGIYVHPQTLQETSIRENILECLDWLAESSSYDSEIASLLLELQQATAGPTHADELMRHYAKEGTMEDVVVYSMERFLENEF